MIKIVYSLQNIGILEIEISKKSKNPKLTEKTCVKS